MLKFLTMCCFSNSPLDILILIHINYIVCLCLRHWHHLGIVPSFSRIWKFPGSQKRFFHRNKLLLGNKGIARKVLLPVETISVIVLLPNNLFVGNMAFIGKVLMRKVSKYLLLRQNFESEKFMNNYPQLIKNYRNLQIWSRFPHKNLGDIFDCFWKFI